MMNDESKESIESDEVEIIQPEQAAAILEPRIAELEAEGWIVLVRHDYMARLTRGKRNLDLQVDLLGEILTEEKPLTLAQESGQIIAILLMLVFLLLAITLVSALRLF
ncbi:MAG TPA: hypothetical protein VJZ27_18450 [Aggregatilineales bacterium]|nr:hypothetical protein [Aggregatilineales bacterium]